VAADQTPEDRTGIARSTSGLGPHVVGVRVVVRRVLRREAGPTGGPAMTDVLGVCESWEQGRMTVRREDGSVVEIATADIVSGKPVPPRPSVHRRLGAEQADRLVLPGWRPARTEALGEWLLRESGGFSSRGNSVFALGDPGLPIGEAVTQVTRWYAARQLPPRAHVHRDSPATTAFAAAGWSRYETTVLMLASVSRAVRRIDPDPSVRPRHDTTLDRGWLATDERAARHGTGARSVLEAGEVTFATVRGAGDEVLARGRGAFHGDWLGVSSLWTRKDRRGAGLGTAVLASLLEWGAERGATTSYLQVVEANTAARRLYEARGYEAHHTYDYLVAPD
jgi:ribosomal protein S18 acetylase RimI-like enzyme